MLINTFCNIFDVDVKAGVIVFTLTTNKDHEIYKGHFPGHPVTPGVCILQIVKELVEITSHKQLVFSSAKTIRFLNMLNPEDYPEFCCKIESSETDNHIVANVTVYYKDVTFCTIKNANYDIYQ